MREGLVVSAVSRATESVAATSLPKVPHDKATETISTTVL